MRQTCVLEPFHPNEKDEEDEGKICWEQIKKYLENYKSDRGEQRCARPFGLHAYKP